MVMSLSSTSTRLTISLWPSGIWKLHEPELVARIDGWQLQKLAVFMGHLEGHRQIPMGSLLVHRGLSPAGADLQPAV
jgi:hypothetical protein